MTGATIQLFRPGLVEYGAALRWQQTTATALREGKGAQALALLQHPPIFTLGRRTRPENLTGGREALAALGAEVVDVDRGGDVTFHGPGQLVAYPVLELRRHNLGPVDYVRLLEETIIRALATFDIVGARAAGRPGAWVEGEKIAAIGVRVAGGVTTHGFALNVSTDLRWFEAIVPCGLAGTQVTSMERVLGRPVEMSAAESAVVASFEKVFDTELVAAGSSPMAREPIISNGR